MTSKTIAVAVPPVIPGFHSTQREAALLLRLPLRREAALPEVTQSVSLSIS